MRFLARCSSFHIFVLSVSNANIIASRYRRSSSIIEVSLSDIEVSWSALVSISNSSISGISLFCYWII